MLSICIPTYNRAELLDRCISNIRKRIVEHGHGLNFEICISDNASTDHTPAVIEKHQKECKEIVSIRQPTNLGFANNFKTVLKLASKEWAIVIGDDDVVSENFIHHIKSAFNTEKPLVIFSSEFGEKTREDANNSGSKTQLTTPAQVLRKIGMFQLTFIGNLMFRMNFVQPNLAELTVQSAYPQTVLAWKLIDCGGADLIETPIVVADYGHRPWTKCQPLYTSLDMARIMTCGPFKHPSLTHACMFLCYFKLLKSLPRAIIGIRQGVIPQSQHENPFVNLTNRNLLAAYAGSPFIGVLACTIKSTLQSVPTKFINFLASNRKQ